MKEQIKGILQQNRKAHIELRGKLSAFRQANAETKESFGEAQARADFQKMVPVMEDLFVLKQRARSQINAILTPEQRAKLERIRTERRSKQQIQIATLRLRHRAQVRNILDQTMTKIQSILTSDQQRKMEPILNNNSCSD